MAEIPSYVNLPRLPIACHAQENSNNTEAAESGFDKKTRLGHTPTNNLIANSCRSDDPSDSRSLIKEIGRDNSVSCLLCCSRSDYGIVASLNRGFRDLVRSGELYRLRRQLGIVEHWVYFSCNLLGWEAFDPIRGRFMVLPYLPANQCFMLSDKESLAVGTELLVFGKGVGTHVIYEYNILSNSWSMANSMNVPRCLFASTSVGETAVVAGGCDSRGEVLRSAELYDLRAGTWEALPPMKKKRRMPSAVFMEGKFFVVGGMGEDHCALTCGETYDFETRTWDVIPDAFLPWNASIEVAHGAPPLIAVVNDVLYAADCVQKKVRKYDKKINSWIDLGGLPPKLDSRNGWEVGFRACGDQLMIISRVSESFIEINSWAPSKGLPEWKLHGRKNSGPGSFIYNCAVMGI